MEDQTQAFPMDWDQWRAEWRAWLAAHADDLKPTRERFPGQNFMADDVLGTWKIKGQLVELSAFTFPNLEERDERGLLIDKEHRSVGITRGVGLDSNGAVVRSFSELERELGIEPIIATIERARIAQERNEERSSSESCEMVYDGTDTNGDVWNRCTVHNRLVLGDAYVCEGYEAPAYVEPTSA